MSSVRPIVGPGQPSPSDPAAGTRKKAEPKTSFANAMKNVIDMVDRDQQTSSEAIRDLIAGKNKDIIPVVQAVAKADLSFKLLIGVRNKVIEAYQRTMQMQV